MVKQPRERVIAALIIDDQGYWHVGQYHSLCKEGIPHLSNGKKKVGERKVGSPFLTSEERVVYLDEAKRIMKKARQYPRDGMGGVVGECSESLFRSTEGIGYNLPLAKAMAEEYNLKVEERIARAEAGKLELASLEEGAYEQSVIREYNQKRTKLSPVGKGTTEYLRKEYARTHERGG